MDEKPHGGLPSIFTTTVRLMITSEKSGLGDTKELIVFTSGDGHEVTVTATPRTLPDVLLRGAKLLKESAATLRILFRFLEAERHPALENEPFDFQLAVAEAAEKYSVFSAMNFCRFLFRYVRIPRWFSMADLWCQSNLAQSFVGDILLCYPPQL